MDVTVIGAGTMGSGIAQTFAQAGFTTRLHDMDAAAIDRAITRLRGGLQKRVDAGKMDQSVVDGTFARLSAAPDFNAAVADADLVVEAIFEDLKVKQDLFGRLGKAARKDAVLATNTSSLRVADLAAATAGPERVVGLHFFFPAHINRLVEVVRGPATSDAAFDAAFEAVRRAGKVPIETADASGFCVNRFFVPWVNEACRLLDEGHSIATIDAAAKEAFGITMGPFELMNVTGVPISLHAQRTLHKAFGPFYEPASALVKQVEAKKDWDLAGTPGNGADVAARLRGVVFGIACHLVEEGVARRTDTDKGATVGLRWTKGPFAMMNALGLEHAMADVRAVHEGWGDAFAVPATLAERAASGAGWDLPDVTCTLDGDVGIITFDRPQALNALNAKVLQDLDACLDEVEGCRAVVVTGEGKAFVAGADIPTMKAMTVEGAKEYTAFGHRVLDRLAGLPCPVLMAINGHCLGGGLELALCGDLLYASDKAVLGLPEVGLGIHPGFGGTQRLPRRVGVGYAKDLIFTGRTVSAEEAAGIGLVNGVVAHGDLMPTVLGIARGIAAKAPLAVAGAKRSVDAGLGQDLVGGLATERESVVLLFATKDKDEGLGAFMERRKPVFKGA